MKPDKYGARRRLDVLYAELPALDCKGLCAESCGPIRMSRAEWVRITDRLGHEPEALPDGTCPMLTDGRCSVYDIRPMLCRLWGIVEVMPCRFGCEPARPLTREEGYVFLERAAAIGQ